MEKRVSKRAAKLAVLMGCGGLLTVVAGGCTSLFVTVAQGVLGGYLSQALADAINAALAGGGS